MQSRSFSPPLETTMNFAYLTAPGIKSIRFYELHIQFIVGNRRDQAIDKRAGEIRTRDTGIPIHFRYREWKSESMALRNHTRGLPL